MIPRRNPQSLPQYQSAYPRLWNYAKTFIPPVVMAGTGAYIATGGRGPKFLKGKWNVKAPKKRVTIPKQNKRRISYLSKKMDNNEATIINRVRNTGVYKCDANECAYQQNGGLFKSVIETAITTLKYFDPAQPGTLVTVDYNEGTFQKRILIKGKSSLELRNNYAVPVKLEVFLCRVKADTNNSPVSAITAGFADVGGLAVTDVMSKAKDSLILRDLWTLKLKKKLTLEPGKQIKFFHSEKEFSYDTSLVDTHNQTYVKMFKSFSWLVRVEGVNAHDTTVETEQGTSAAAVDITVDREIMIKYDGGIDLYEIQTTNGSSTFSNADPHVTVLENEQQNFQI